MLRWEADLLSRDGMCSRAKINHRAPVEAGEHEVEAGTSDDQGNDEMLDNDRKLKRPCPAERSSQTEDDNSLILLGCLQGEEEWDGEGDDHHEEGEQLQDARETF